MKPGSSARYVLNGNAEDSSRNHFHARCAAPAAAFVEDPLFRNVLLLTGDGSHLQLPAAALSGEDTFSVTGWLFLPTGASGPFFDFGSDAANRLFAVASREGFRASVVAGGNVRGETAAKPLVENQWVHVAVVLDPARRVLTTYVDGAKAARRLDVALNGHADAPLRRPLAGRRRADASWPAA